MFAWKYISTLIYGEQFSRESYQCSLKLAVIRSEIKIKKYLQLIEKQKIEISNSVNKDEAELVTKLKVQALLELKKKKKLTKVLMPHYELLNLFSESNNHIIDKNSEGVVPNSIIPSICILANANRLIDLNELQNIVKQLKLLYSEKSIENIKENYQILDEDLKSLLNVVYDPVKSEKAIYHYLSKLSPKYLEKYKKLHLYPIEMDDHEIDPIEYRTSQYIEPNAPPFNPDDDYDDYYGNQ